MKGYWIWLLVMLIMLSGCSTPVEDSKQESSVVMEESSIPEESSVISQESSKKEESSVAEESSITEESSEREQLPPPVEELEELTPVDIPYKELTPVPLDEGRILPILELPQGTLSEFPQIYGLEYASGWSANNLEQLCHYMENAALRLWPEYEVKESGLEHNRKVQYYTPWEETAYGDYREVLTAENGHLEYKAAWRNAGTLPFRYGEQVQLSEEEVLALAKAFLDQFGMNSRIGELTSYRESMINQNKTDNIQEECQQVSLQWEVLLHGLPMAEQYLTMEIVNGQVVEMELDLPGVEATDREFEYVLTAEQALYCINYTRSTIREDSELYTYSKLQSVEPAWITRGRVTPAWKMIFTSVVGEELVVYVDALSCDIWWPEIGGMYPQAYVEAIPENTGVLLLTPEENAKMEQAREGAPEPLYTEVEPLSTAEVFELFTLPEGTQPEWSVIADWEYEGMYDRNDELDELAQEAAGRLWERYTVTKQMVDGELKGASYRTIQGEMRHEYEERISVTEDCFKYERHKLSEEVVELDNEGYVRTALEMLHLLGMEEYVSGQPAILQDENLVYVQWYVYNVGGSKNPAGVRVVFQDGQIATALLRLPTASMIHIEETPDVLLTAEEALYCINYAKSLSFANEGSYFEVMPELLEVRPAMTTMIDDPEYKSYCYVWEFIFKRVVYEGGKVYDVGTKSIYVDALTGDIHTKGRRDGTYSSPLR